MVAPMDDNLSQYMAVQHLVSTGDLVEWRSESMVGRAIRLFTRQEVNHSSLVVRLPYECCERRFCIEALERGLEFRLLSRRLLGHAGQAWWWRLKPEYDPLRDQIGRWAFDMLSENRGYDFGSLFAQIFGRVSLDARRFFCSEFYDAMLLHFGMAPADPAGARRPGEFGNLGIFEARAPLL